MATRLNYWAGCHLVTKSVTMLLVDAEAGPYAGRAQNVRDLLLFLVAHYSGKEAGGGGQMHIKG